MTDWLGAQPTEEQVSTLLDGLTYTDEVIDESELPPPGAPVKVVRSVRLPFEVDERLVAHAKERGVSPSELGRQMIEAGLAAMENPGDQLVSRTMVERMITDAIEKAIALVPTVGRQAA